MAKVVGIIDFRGGEAHVTDENNENASKFVNSLIDECVFFRGFEALTLIERQLVTDRITRIADLMDKEPKLVPRITN